MDKFLEQLAQRLRFPDDEIVSADEIAGWPAGKLDELMAAGILARTENAKGVVCDECEENCCIEPEIRTIPDTGETIGIFICTRNPDVGRIEINLDRLRQWRIDKDKLQALGLLKKGAARKKRRISSELTGREREAYQLVYVQNKTQRQAAIEMRCKPQNISQLLKKAEEKVKASASRSISSRKVQRLPEDKRGQVHLSDDRL